jgi:DNA-binding MarR family transcriptional regulator
MYKLKFTLLQQEILRFLSIKSGLSFNARRLSQHLNVSQTAIAKSLPLLEKENFIKIEKDRESARLAIELNRDSPKVIQFKRAENLKLIYESGLIDFLKQKFSESEIILSGLYSKGEDIYSSIIYLIIIGPKKNLNLNDFDKILDRRINLVFYNSINEIDNKILTEGIEL